MRQLIRWTARLYPARWRARYGEELDALVEDLQPEWEDLFNVLLGALRMHMTAWNSLKIVATVALAGALDPPSTPQQPIFPNRPMIVAVGLLGGAVSGWLAVLVWRGAIRLSRSA